LNVSHDQLVSFRHKVESQIADGTVNHIDGFGVEMYDRGGAQQIAMFAKLKRFGAVGCRQIGGLIQCHGYFSESTIESL